MRTRLGDRVRVVTARVYMSRGVGVSLPGKHSLQYYCAAAVLAHLARLCCCAAVLYQCYCRCQVMGACIGHHLTAALHRSILASSESRSFLSYPAIHCYPLLSINTTTARRSRGTAINPSRLLSSTPVHDYILLNSCAAYYHTHDT